MRLDGYYRFNQKHAVEASYYGVRSEGSTILNGDIEWNGDTIAAGASSQSYFDMDVFKINYMYSFYHSDRVELALAAGLHVTKVELGLSASGQINGQPGEHTSSSGSVTAPLPIIGFRLGYEILPKYLFAYYQADYFYLNFDNYAGGLVNNSFSLEYRFVEHVGIGLGFDATTINVEMDDGDKRVDVENKFSGFMFYFTYVY